MLMNKIKLASIHIVSVCDLDYRSTAVCKHKKQFFFYLFEISAFNLIHISRPIISVSEKFMFSAEILCKKLINKSHVIIKLPHLEYLISPKPKLHVPFSFYLNVITFLVFLSKFSFVPSILDVSKKLHSHLIWV